MFFLSHFVSLLGYMFPEPGGPMYRRPPPPPGAVGVLHLPGSLPPGPPYLRGFPSAPPPGPPHPTDMAGESAACHAFSLSPSVSFWAAD